MKKLALSIAVSSIVLAAAGAQADETVFENDSVALTLGADVEYVASYTSISEEFAYEVDSADLDVTITTTLENGVEVFGYFEIEGDSEQDALALDDSYVGATFDATTVKFGETTTAGDEFGIGEDYWFGGSNAIAQDSGYEVINVAYSADEFSVVAAYDLDESEDGYTADVYGEVYLGDITVAGLLQSSDVGGDSTSFGASIAYGVDAYTVAAELTTETEAEVTSFKVAGTYAVSDAATLKAGFDEPDTDTDDDTVMYANVNYALNDNAEVNAEFATSDGETGFALGLAVGF